MEFLKWYSALVISWFALVAVLLPSNGYAFLGGLMFVPVSIFLWKIILDKKI
jgi:hypothetical protein